MRDNYTDIRTLYYNLLQDNITLNGNTVNVYDVVKADETNPYIYFAEFEAVEDSCKDNFTTRVTIGLVVVSKFTNAVGGSTDVDNVATQILKLLHNDTYLNNSNFRVVLNKMIANFVTKQPTQTGTQINKTIRLEHVVEQIGGDLTRITDLTATRVSNTQIDLAWSNVTGNTGYRIERSTDGYTWALVTSVAQDTVSYSNTGLTNDVTYSYRVRAFDATGGSAWSNIASVTAYSSIGVTPTGIAYQRPSLSGQTTSYATYDDAWHLANGSYDYTPPANPEYIAELDTTAINPFITLKNNNAFGDLNRFTDELGTQIYANDYLIDHLTGLGWTKLRPFTGTYADALPYSNTYTLLGFTDFRAPSCYESLSLNSLESTGVTTPFTYSTRIHSTTTNHSNTAQVYYPFFIDGRMLTNNKTASSLEWAFCRNHYT